MALSEGSQTFCTCISFLRPHGCTAPCHITSSRHGTTSASVSHHAGPTAARTACTAASHSAHCTSTLAVSLRMSCTPTCTWVSEGYIAGREGSIAAAAVVSCEYSRMERCVSRGANTGGAEALSKLA